MIKIIAPNPRQAPGAEESWLPAEKLSLVEITSEDPEHPIEDALSPGTNPEGWRAGAAGEQTIRVGFGTPLHLSMIHLVFHEGVEQRTQEFSLSWLDADEHEHHILRQQYNFSPPDNGTEVENFRVDVHGAAALLLRIRPNIQGGPTRATLAELRLAGSSQV
jgi:hypothetical protein